LLRFSEIVKRRGIKAGHDQRVAVEYVVEIRGEMWKYDREDDKRYEEKFDPRLHLVIIVETPATYHDEKAEQIFAEKVVGE
jgi:hypothetical protein